MKNERFFYKCEKCGNMVGMIESSGEKLTCCGQEMTRLVPNTVDAAQEKHVPSAKLEGNTLTVTVGSVIHPMTEEHHISWISIAQGNMTQRVTLDKTGAPTAVFHVGKGDITIYEYCNLHGLWSADINNS